MCIEDEFEKNYLFGACHKLQQGVCVVGLTGIADPITGKPAEEILVLTDSNMIDISKNLSSITGVVIRRQKVTPFDIPFKQTDNFGYYQKWIGVTSSVTLSYRQEKDIMKYKFITPFLVNFVDELRKGVSEGRISYVLEKIKWYNENYVVPEERRAMEEPATTIFSTEREKPLNSVIINSSYLESIKAKTTTDTIEELAENNNIIDHFPKGFAVAREVDETLIGLYNGITQFRSAGEASIQFGVTPQKIMTVFNEIVTEIRKRRLDFQVSSWPGNIGD